MAKGLGLTVRKSVLFDKHTPADGLLPSILDFGKLGGQPFDEVFQSASHVHAALAEEADNPIDLADPSGLCPITSGGNPFKANPVTAYQVDTHNNPCRAFKTLGLNY